MSDFDSNSVLDEDERMDLALNSDLRSSLLDCWDETTARPLSRMASRSPSVEEQNWESMIMVDEEGNLPFQPDASKRKATVSRESAAAPSGGDSKPPASNDHNNSGTAVTQLHPQAIQSSADCPPHAAAALNLNNALNFGLAPTLPAAMLPFAFANPALIQQSLNLLQQGAAAVVPPGTAAPTTTTTTTTAPSRKKTKTATSKTAPVNVPPFHLFDAPVELRSNFMNAQRALGLPVLQDNNSFHYNNTGSSFHPDNLRLVDGRRNKVMSAGKREKNAKEQKRARQITKLIDQLRTKMEKDGWHVEFRSKLHTLASCSDYVKHLVKVNKEKEAAIEKAKQDLEAKQRRLEDDKAQQDPSDPESMTSELTESSGSAGVVKLAGEIGDTGDKERTTRRVISYQSSATSSATEESSGNTDPQIDSVPANLASSSVSDVTDSNKDTASSSKDVTISDPSSESSSTNNKETKKHADVVVKEKRKHELDYEEIFLRSNVPQVLSSTAGRIVSWNDCFVRATGLSASELKRLTIFSLVQPSHLASLFDIVAAALRENSPPQSTEEATDYSAITLPCVNFSRPNLTRRPLFLTATLMNDEDLRKRCFHCILTDCPGTNGSLGQITPEMMFELFQQPEHPDQESPLPPTKKRKT